MLLLMPSADYFSKLTFSKNYFRNIVRVSNSLDPDQAWSGSKLFAKVISRRQIRQRVKIQRSARPLSVAMCHKN